MSVSPLDRLAERVGVVPEYRDAFGETRRVPDATKRALLSAMGFAVASEDEVEGSLVAFDEAPWRRRLDPVVVVREPALPARIPVIVAAAELDRRLAWRLESEAGEVVEGEIRPRDLSAEATRELDGRTVERRVFVLPASPALGYHRLAVAGEGGEEEATTLIVAPPRCFLPPALERGRAWGFSVQLYGLRSECDWGMGDFTDLRALVERAAPLGAGAIGLNPLHALFPARPEHTSPYSPSSRLFLNVFYLDPRAVDDFAECEAAQELCNSKEFKDEVEALRESGLVAHERVGRLKLRVLERLYESFVANHLHTEEASRDPRVRDFWRFQNRHGTLLSRFAVFDALSEHFRRETPDAHSWRDWPEAYRSPDAPAVEEFATRNHERVRFYAYLQWQADLQLGAASEAAERAGMTVGLYHDLAVGVDDTGADAWAQQDLLVQGMTVGAPPDDYNLKGQNWGFRPYDPLRVRAAAYAPFVALLRANMRHGGALRIDHVLGLNRMFWIPAGAPPTEGGYVRNTLDELLAIIALESHRQHCLVIGEDLGTVPEGLRETLQQAGLLSYRLLYFEREADGAFTPPARYPANALVAISTHDLPPLPGYWAANDLELRARLDLFPTGEAERTSRRARETDRRELVRALAREGLLPSERAEGRLDAGGEALAEPAYRYLARTPGRLLIVHFEDPLGVVEQINMPGTFDQHPNWRRKLPLPLERLLSDPRVTALAAAINEIRPPRPEAETAGVPAADRGPPAVPVATYRLQFNQDFTFADAEALVPYLGELGVSHLYASPYLKARAGSPHGYDITDHNAINPEIGDLAGLDRLCAALAGRGMGHVLDFVPNHMGIARADNAWWLDVLEWGRASPYARFFDIDWEPAKADLRGKVLVPFLGDHYGTVLEDEQLELRFDSAEGSFSVWYHEHRLPITPRHYGRILDLALERLREAEGAGAAALERLVTEFRRLRPAGVSTGRRAAFRERARELKDELAELTRSDLGVAAAVTAAVEAFNGQRGVSQSFARLHRLLEGQNYRLSFWRVAAHEVNYRRFFDINELAGLRAELPELFEIIHRLVLRLVAEGKLHGLRIDHVDGLFDPADYCARLQARAAALMPKPEAEPVETPAAADPEGPPFYLLVEKILARHEFLRHDWPVHGTTGYEFANLVNGLFVDPAADAALTRLYARFAGETRTFDDVLYEAKKRIMQRELAGELSVLANEFDRISESHWRTRDFTLDGLRAALEETIACFPVYRTYVTSRGADAEDRRYIDWAVSQAQKRNPGLDPSILDFVHAVLSTDLVRQRRSGYNRREVVRLAMKFQQYTGPVMAKSLEDTAFYRYFRLVSLNEVGGDPRHFGTTVAAFHHLNQERLRHWPHSMLATATHDTKRGEDVRARIDVLSEMPGDWSARARRWARLNRAWRRELDGLVAPTRNDEYLLYQTLLGAWPVDAGGATRTPAEVEAFAGRVERYMIKAMREAKQISSWSRPNGDYEEAVRAFIKHALDAVRPSPFLDDLLPFVERVARLGMLNGLSQTLLKLTVPGVPDIYRGTEFWDLNLVDPDNRRPVDWAARRARLAALKQEAAAANALAPVARRLLEEWTDGSVKLYLIWRTLAARHAHEPAFRSGAYVPLEAEGPRADHLCAFARGAGRESVVVVAPRLFAGLVGDTGAWPLGAETWGETRLCLPGEVAPGPYRNAFTDEVVHAREAEDGAVLDLAAALDAFPVALLTPAGGAAPLG